MNDRWHAGDIVSPRAYKWAMDTSRRSGQSVKDTDGQTVRRAAIPAI